MNIDFKLLKTLIDEKRVPELKKFLSDNELEINNGKIYPKNPIDVKEAIKYWDAMQHARKINLNALYGALLNENGRYFDQRLGQSTTLTGRVIARHMDATVNESLTGKYDHMGESIIYGDSVTGDTMILTEDGDLPISELYNICPNHGIIDEKEYGLNLQSKIVGYNALNDEPVTAHINYVMRHKTKKKLYKIITENDEEITVTEDHSVMIDRDGFLIEVKPNDIQIETDLIIRLVR